MALRFDTIRLDASKFQRTAAGLIRVDATVAKAGVYSYRGPDGKTVREYLPPEEVTKADSLASLEDATVTNRHPTDMVHPGTWGSVAIGHASRPRSEGDKAVATLVISRKDAQDLLGSDLVEVSRGVRVRIDDTPGFTPDGEVYDVVQRDIVYNHIALGPANWGRQGKEVALRLDAAGDELISNPERTDQVMKIKHLGKDIEFKTDAEAQAFVDGLSRADAFPPKKSEADLEEEDKKKKAEKKDADDALKAATDRADAAQAKLDAIETQACTDARSALEAKATAVLGKDWRADSAAKDRDIHAAVLAKLSPTVKFDSRSDVYVEAAFDHALTVAPSTSGSRSDAIAAGLGGVGPGGFSVVKTDSTEPAKLVGPDKVRKDASEAWKKPGVQAR